MLQEAKKKSSYDLAGWGDRMKKLSPEQQRRNLKNFGQPPDPWTSPDASYRKNYGAQQRGPTPTQGGGRTQQPLGHSRSGRGVIRKGVVGAPPKGTLPPPGEKFKDDKKKKQAEDFFMGRQATMQFESRLLDALYSDRAFLMEAIKRQKPVRAEMSGGKKVLIGAALAAALAAGLRGGGGKAKEGGPEKTQDTHQTQRWTGQEKGSVGTGVNPMERGPSGQVGEHPGKKKESETEKKDNELMRRSKELRDSIPDLKPPSLGKGRVTQDNALR